VGAGHDEHKDIEQTFYLADHLDHKKQLLQHIIKDSDKQIIIFIATRDDTDLLAAEVNELGLKAIAISGNLSQSKRNQAIDEFSRNRHQVLVTTDIAARGLDLRHVGIVINFDMPKHAEEYVHRIGRTGRAGYKGVAYSLVSRKDWQSFEQVQGFLQLDITFAEIDGLTAKFKGFEPGQKVNQPAAVSAEKTKQAKRNTKKTKSSKVKRTVKMLAPKIDIDKPPVKKR
jgi:superfamily II DNA/RNA helicase